MQKYCITFWGEVEVVILKNRSSNPHDGFYLSLVIKHIFKHFPRVATVQVLNSVYDFDRSLGLSADRKDSIHDIHVLNSAYDFDRSLGLSADRKGYILTVDVAKNKFRTVRTQLLPAIKNYMVSGGGDGEPIEESVAHRICSMHIAP